MRKFLVDGRYFVLENTIFHPCVFVKKTQGGLAQWSSMNDGNVFIVHYRASDSSPEGWGFDPLTPH